MIVMILSRMTLAELVRRTLYSRLGLLRRMMQASIEQRVDTRTLHGTGTSSSNPDGYEAEYAVGNALEHALRIRSVPLSDDDDETLSNTPEGVDRNIRSNDGVRLVSVERFRQKDSNLPEMKFLAGRDVFRFRPGRSVRLEQ